jgi:hypothetical protein
MVNTRSMKLIKHVERQVLKNVFLIEIELKINSSYFINKIEEGIYGSNNNYLTHVRGKMTSWDYFAKDENFLSLVKTGVNYLDENISLVSCYIRDAWGTKIDYNDRVREHDHSGCIISGVLYLQDSKQNLYFKELNISINPKKGKLLLFSSNLRHGTKFSLDKKPRYSIAFNYVEDEGQKWK